MRPDDIRHIDTVLKEWNKFPANADADFNCLVNEVVVALEEGFGSADLISVIHNEFVNHFGEPGPDEDVADIAEVLTQWWSSKQSA